LLKEEFIHEIFINREKSLEQKLTRIDTIILLVLAKDNDKAQIWEGESLACGWEGVGIEKERINQIICDGKKLLGAPRLEPGFYDCIVEPSVSGMIAHEAFGHGTEVDMFIRDRSRGKDFLGKPVASSCVSMIDYSRYTEATTLFFFDHDGMEARPTCVIEQGTLKCGLSDEFSSKKAKLPKTPNGRRESFDRKIYSRMSNTYFTPGEDSLDEMIKSIAHGFIIRYPTNGMEDPKQWGIQVETLMAEEIREGKRTGNFFSPVIITGYVPDLLHSITMVSKDFKISTLGMCGKGYKEWVKVHDGGPWLKLKARLG
jgi:TldD protein